MSTTLIDLTEVAAILNVTVSTARRYRTRYRYPTRSRDQFPSPVTYVGVSPMWLRADIAAWHEGDPLPAVDRQRVVTEELGDLVTRAEAARLLGLRTTTLTRYLLADEATRGFPRPVIVAGRSSLWSRRDLRQWGAHRRPRGRPRSHQRSKFPADPAPVERPDRQRHDSCEDKYAGAE